jgi:uncharacterized lipoprotein NlpE involved in copper resistance
MKNKILTFSSVIGVMLFVFTLFSCDTQNKTTSKNTDMTHSAQNSLDYDGIYRGTIPCADCEGIKATVYLMRDQTFKTVYDYLGKEAEPFETTGKFSWNKEGNSITLQAGKEKTSYFVGENTLTQLDQNGEKMTGELAQKYILTKDNYRILNRKWKLAELMGKPVTNSQTMEKEAYIQFIDKDNSYSAYAGCNRMSGSFAVESYNRLKLGMGISTMMACQNMTIENELSKVLSTADSFQIDGNNLVLIKGRMAPLAKFIAPVN